ncbi:MAG: sugar ABC transporter permease [Ignisphaera sp.]
MASQSTKNIIIALAMMAPFLILYLIFTIFPAFYAFYYSLYRTSPTGELFIGLGNYIYYLTGRDSRFVYGMQNVLIYGIANILTLIIALITAWVISSSYVSNRRYINFVQIVMLLPMVIPWVALGMALNQSTSSVLGIAMYFNNNIRIQHPANDFNMARWYVSSLIIWATLGYNTMLTTATLRTLPQDYIDAAKIDGASEWQIFRHVVLPLIKNIIVFSAIGAIIAAFNIFDPVATLTGGGPAWISTSVAYYAARQLMYAYNYGGACAMGVIVISVVLIISIVQYRFIYKRIV